MRAKKIASAAIVALKEALTNLYWYKGDLRSFLTSTLTNPALLSRLNWGDAASVMLLEGRLTPGGRGLVASSRPRGFGPGRDPRQRAFILPMPYRKGVG